MISIDVTSNVAGFTKDSIYIHNGEKKTGKDEYAQDHGAQYLVVAYYQFDMTDQGTIEGDNNHTIKTANFAKACKYTIEYKVYAKKAGTYEVSAVALKDEDNPEKNNHTVSINGKTQIRINRRAIGMTFEIEESPSGSLQDSYEFDGGLVYRGITTITLNNIASADLKGVALADLLTFKFSGNESNVASIQQPTISVDTNNGKVTILIKSSDVGYYKAELSLNELFAGSYMLPAIAGTLNGGREYKATEEQNGVENWSANWSITPYIIETGDVTIEGKTVYYNGQKQSVKITGTGFNASGVKPIPVGNETYYVSINFVEGEGKTDFVNASDKPYKISVVTTDKFGGEAVRNGSSKATAEDEEANYELKPGVVNEGGNTDLFILPREIKVEWNGTLPTSMVYSGLEQGLKASNVVLWMNMKEKPSDSDDWQQVGTVEINGNTLTVSGLLTHNKPQGGEVSESISFDINEFTATDAGSYTATIGSQIASVGGKNDIDDVQKSNYALESTPDGHAYTIAKSEIVISVTSHNIKGKVFDGNSVIYETLPSLNIDSNNGGAKNCNVSIRNARYYDSKNSKQAYYVGKGYDIYLDFKFANASDEKNFIILTNNLIVDADAEITPKGITIILNTTSGATATKVFDNSNIYAAVNSKGADTVKSSGNQFKPGRGITVEGFITSGVTVTAYFQEIGNGRSAFDAYVNDVYIDNSNKYKQASAGTYFKQLHIALSNNSGDNEMNNYYIAKVCTKSGETLVSQASGSTINVPDSRADGSVTEGKNFKVTITPYSIKATYKYTAQSYANPDNTYNTNWTPVECQDNKVPDSFGIGNDLKVVVDNGWMTDSKGNPEKYNKYTRIAGKKGNTELGAYLDSDKGYEYCFNLRTQPTLIIGYFVEQPDGYGIGTMAGLLIATEYFKGNFSTENKMSYDYVQTPIDIKDKTLINNLPTGTWNSWEELFAEVDYNIAGYEHNGTTYPAANIYKDIQNRITEAQRNNDTALVEALETELASFEVVFEQLEGQQSVSLQLVYWKAQEIVDGTKYKKFYLTNNIDGILTASDMEILKGAFGDSEFGVKWGAGTAFLSNVLFAEEGSVVIFNNSVFEETIGEDGKVYGFDGTFNGMGYTINHLNITKVITSAENDDKINVGMFASVHAPANPEEGGGNITALNFRNLTIYVVDNSGANVTINVGAVAGNYGGTAVMQNVTVHGTISVKSNSGTVNVGGVLGYDHTGYEDGQASAVLDGVIVVATIRAEGAKVVAGGIVGVMSAPNTTLTDLVSLSEIYAKGATESATVVANGFVGEYYGMVGSFAQMKSGSDYTPISTDGKQSAYMDAVFTINADGVYTRVAPTSYAKTYTELYNGSNTAFEKSGNDYIYSNAVGQAYGIYDVVGEKNTMAGTNTTGSMRLKDIVDIYVLGYGLTKKTVGEIDTFKKESTSKYFHAIDSDANDDNYKPDGTEGNPIIIAYQQHLSLLRMFNYMNFELAGDIKMYTGYSLAIVDEAFTGTVDANGHEVNFRNGTAGQMFAYQSNNGAKNDKAEESITYTWVTIDSQDEE